jgi:L-lactate dehydrogenase complex protein LldG
VSAARQEILRRIRTALSDRPEATPVRREYRQASGAVGDPDLFAERVIDYRANVRRCAEPEVAATLAAALADRGARRVVVPVGFPTQWLAGIGELAVADEPPLGTADLDRLDGVVTTCAVAVAETGTIVLDAGAGQGRRALSLVPDYHLAVVRAGQIVATVPDAVAALDPVRPLTWISGPSATSDIELSRVEGVHGPRTLEVLLVASAHSPTSL